MVTGSFAVGDHLRYCTVLYAPSFRGETGGDVVNMSAVFSG